MNDMNNSIGIGSSSSSSVVSYHALPVGVRGAGRDSYAQGGTWRVISHHTMLGDVMKSELLSEINRVHGHPVRPLMKLVNCCAPAVTAVGCAAEPLWVISYRENDE
jgi:hypothetical protein